MVAGDACLIGRHIGRLPAVAFLAESSRVLAYYLHHLSPFIVQFRNGIGLRWYGLAYVLGFLLGYWLYRWLAERGYTDMPPALVQEFITWAAVFGVMLGGRLGWILFYGWPDVREHPLAAFEVWKGGMASHGGILGLFLFTLWYAKRHRLSWTSIGDSLVVVAPIGIFLVRCANFINGELWGKPALVPGRCNFPRNWRRNPGVAAQTIGCANTCSRDTHPRSTRRCSKALCFSGCSGFCGRG